MTEIAQVPENTPLTDEEVVLAVNEYLDSIYSAVALAHPVDPTTPSQPQNSVKNVLSKPTVYTFPDTLVDGTFYTPRVSLLKQVTERPLTDDTWEKIEAHVDIFPAAMPVVSVPSYRSPYSSMRVSKDTLRKSDGTEEVRGSISYLPVQHDLTNTNTPRDSIAVNTKAQLEQIKAQPVAKFLL